MNSPPSDSETSSFLLLDDRIQRWIWAQGWTTLRTVQEYAIPALITGENDVILAAATSAGKTEAAFFPILTRLLQAGSNPGFILSISPLKALINDQTQRLSALCESLDLPVLGWHGDIPATRKLRFLKEMSGILIITPESLEALFVNKGTTIPAFAQQVRCVVIDELHSFLGTERGKQVQSLVARLELAAGRRVPRVGLSATLGDKGLAADFLRPDSGKNVLTIDAGADGYELKLVVKGYVDEFVTDKTIHQETQNDREESSVELTDKQAGSAKFAISDYLYQQLRGTNNLVFPNSRSKVEFYTDQLRRRCEQDRLPNEFWAHHGSLSREIREEAESALKGDETAATAICTNTLELGIDIGNIRSVVQIGPPPSVASLRQRLGRSGRRAGEPAILRCLAIEQKLSSDSPFSDRIREGLVQTVAMVRLLLQQWVEPPRKDALHASTLVQQILSVITQRGGATATELWSILIRNGVFEQISAFQLSGLIRELGARDLVMQDSSGSLLPGTLGEKLINDFDFYSAFTSGEEFRLIAEGRVLGSLPIERPLTPGQRVIFAGRRWRVLDVDTKAKVITVAADRGGSPPAFDGTGGRVHDRVRQEMKQVLSESEPIPFLDPIGASLLEQARQSFREAELDKRPVLADGNSTLLLGWRGDWTNDALSLLLTAHGLHTSNEGITLRVSSSKIEQIKDQLCEIAKGPPLTVADLKLKPEHAIREKWDWALPNEILLHSFASSRLDLSGAKVLAADIVGHT
jgi:ATP-dependent Lhr-like helicase